MELAADFAGFGVDNNFKSSETSEQEMPILSCEDGRNTLLFASDSSRRRIPNNIINPSLTSSESSRLGPQHFSPIRYWKNLIVISLAFLFTFSAYSALANLQSSLNYSSGLGVASLCAIYIAFIISSFLSPLLIWFLKVKWAMVVCVVFYAVYTASNIYPTVFTLLPAALLLGLAASPLWTALGTYITTSAIQLADVSNGIPETIINRFNGVFFCFFQSSQVCGNLISSLVLGEANSTVIYTTDCGLNSCGSGLSFANITEGGTVAKDEELVLISIYIGLGLISPCILVIFLDTLPRVVHQETRTWRSHLYEHLVSVFQIMKSPYLFLLIPLIVYSGAEQAYIGADFTKSFVSCTEGTDMVGYVMIGFGLADAIASVLFGQLEKYLGRIVIFLLGGAVHMALLISFLFWKPESSAMWQLLLMAIGWGIGDAVWQTQVSSILGVLFPEAQEPAFANFRLWQSVGFAITYALTVPTAICVHDIVVGLIGFLALSLICYISLEYLVSRHASRMTDVFSRRDLVTSSKLTNRT